MHLQDTEAIKPVFHRNSVGIQFMVFILLCFCKPQLGIEFVLPWLLVSIFVLGDFIIIFNPKVFQANKRPCRN